MASLLHCGTNRLPAHGRTLLLHVTAKTGQHLHGGGIHLFHLSGVQDHA